MSAFDPSSLNSVSEFFQFCQPSSATLLACLPEAILCALAILALVFDVVCTRAPVKAAASVVIRAALIVLFICAVAGAFPQLDPDCGQLFFFAAIGQLTTPIFIACAFFAINLAGIVRSREKNSEISAPATTHLILVATAAASLLLKSSNFVAFFVLLETLTVCLYALVGSNRQSPYSLEAGVKYLIAGGVSGGLMLFGIVLLYGGMISNGNVGDFGDSLGYFSIFKFLTQNPENLLGIVGAALVLAGVMFKLGVFPMQFWIPDVYQGAPTHVTFFLATVSKATGFFLFLAMLSVFSGIRDILIPVLLGCALISIVYANLTALGQRNVKRLLGLSGVSHAGYLALGALAAFSLMEPGVPNDMFCLTIVVAYLIVYIVTIYPIFSVMARMPQTDDALQNFDDYRALSKKNPFLAGTLAFGLGSLAGIPPTVGFIAKLGLLYVLFYAGFYWTIAVMLACVVAGIYYYFGWFRAAFSGGEDDGKTEAETAVAGTAEYLPVRLCSRVVLVLFSASLVLGSLVYWAVLS